MVKELPGYREQQAEATKDRVAAAARALFAQRGFAGTTITAISETAGVPAQTIYSAFGSKARILARVTEIWMRETRTRELAEAYLQEPDAARRLHLFAALNRHQLDAGADILTISREAARTDPSMAAALAAMMEARAREIATLLSSMQRDLRVGLGLDDALAMTLALSVDAAYATLRDAGWSGPATSGGSVTHWSASCWVEGDQPAGAVASGSEGTTVSEGGGVVGVVAGAGDSAVGVGTTLGVSVGAVWSEGSIDGAPDGDASSSDGTSLSSSGVSLSAPLPMLPTVVPLPASDPPVIEATLSPAVSSIAVMIRKAAAKSPAALSEIRFHGSCASRSRQPGPVGSSAAGSRSSCTSASRSSAWARWAPTASSSP